MTTCCSARARRSHCHSEVCPLGRRTAHTPARTHPQALSRLRVGASQPPPSQGIKAIIAAISSQLERIRFAPSSPTAERPAEEGSSNEGSGSEGSPRSDTPTAEQPPSPTAVGGGQEARRIIRFACEALSNLCGSEACRRTVVAEGGVGALLGALCELSHDAPVVEVACRGLSLFARSEDSRGRVGSPDVISRLSALVKGLAQQDDHGRLAVAAPALALLLDLTRTDLPLELLAQTGGLRAVCELLRSNAANATVALGATRLLAAACRPRGRRLAAAPHASAGVPMLAALLDAAASSAALAGANAAVQAAATALAVGGEGGAAEQAALDELLAHAGTILGAFSHAPVPHGPPIREAGGLEGLLAAAARAGCAQESLSTMMRATLAAAPESGALCLFASDTDALEALFGLLADTGDETELATTALALISRLVPVDAAAVLSPEPATAFDANGPHAANKAAGSTPSDAPERGSEPKLPTIPRKVRSRAATGGTPASTSASTGSSASASSSSSEDEGGICEGSGDQPPLMGCGRQLGWPGPDFVEQDPPPREALVEVAKTAMRTRAAALRRAECDRLTAMRSVPLQELLVFDRERVETSAAPDKPGSADAATGASQPVLAADVSSVTAASAEARHLSRQRAAADKRAGSSSSGATWRPPSGESLRFYSEFESMNLHRVHRVGETEYNLSMAIDTHTRGHTQWYYFRVRGARAGVPYRFNLINMQKGRSLYENGLRPLLYSEKRAAVEGVGWHRAGDDVCYYANFFPRTLPNGKQRSYFTLSFTVSFPHGASPAAPLALRTGPIGASRTFGRTGGDTCYLAHCYPYTVTDLRHDLDSLTATDEGERHPQHTTRPHPPPYLSPPRHRQTSCSAAAVVPHSRR